MRRTIVTFVFALLALWMLLAIVSTAAPTNDGKAPAIPKKSEEVKKAAKPAVHLKSEARLFPKGITTTSTKSTKESTKASTSSKPSVSIMWRTATTKKGRRWIIRQVKMGRFLGPANWGKINLDISNEPHYQGITQKMMDDNKSTFKGPNEKGH
ncbi:hypothetical protein DFJ73DRAFT_755647 [Zopfochytrium polystomum]|nr:hypothetical protein DFJ73DRAFT_755647 [Zopfochytrium polystomum]